MPVIRCSAARGLQGSNADQIKDLNGPFCMAGISVGDAGAFGGADFSWGTDSQGPSGVCG